MKVAVLTSSRADYAGIAPLLKALKKEPRMQVSVIAFGTHASVFHGKTVSNIIADGYQVDYLIESMLLGDSPEAIASAMGLTMVKFSGIWAGSSYNLIITTGDRYEMFAAAAAALPFNIKIAHIHGGEDTEGAIDNVFRHSLSLMATYNFTTTEYYRQRVAVIKNSDKNVYNTGALSIDAMKMTPLLTPAEFESRFNISIRGPYVLITIHPETASLKENKGHIKEFINALKKLKKYRLIITMPNADPMGNYYRQKLHEFIARSENAVGVESFGNAGYFTCMKYCSFLLGNSSSGFVEASFFPKKVINVGNRQKGRLVSENIVCCDNSENGILEAVQKVEKMPPPAPVKLYGNGHAAKGIVKALKSI